MKVILLMLALGVFASPTSPMDKYEILDAEEKEQLFEEIEAQLDIVDFVESIDLEQDEEGFYYYAVKGSNSGESVSFDVALSKKGGCSCKKDGALAPSAHFFWVCINPCF